MNKIKFLTCLLFGSFFLQTLSATLIPDTRWTSPHGGVEITPCVWEGKVCFDVTIAGKLRSIVRLGIDSPEASSQLAYQERSEITSLLLDSQKGSATNSEYAEYLFGKAGSETKIRMRIYENAFAFRYENPEPCHVLKEYSSWQLPEDTDIWFFERPNAWKLKSYAGTYEKCRIGTLPQYSSNSIEGLPMVMEYGDGTYGLISETGLSDYSGMRLRYQEANTFIADFTEGEEGFSTTDPLQTPWRIFFLADDLNALVNQPLIRELATAPDPNLFEDRSYIQPGKCVWRWHTHGLGNPQEEREMIDYAARLDFLWSMVDNGWEKWPEKWERVKELTRYGREKGVRLFFWKRADQLNDPSEDYHQMKSFLDSLARSGASGIKVDYMNSEAKSWIDFDIRLLTECAKRRLCVDFHGCQQPAGECYEFPNELTREGIRGMELNNMREGCVTARHNAALPFTRFVAGPGDYTPLCFTTPGTTSFAHQLATMICFDSPLQVVTEWPLLMLEDEHLLPALDFIRAVPTTWDEVRVLPQSVIGDLAVLAKRKGQDWYIGILNGQKSEVDFQLDLSEFLSSEAETFCYFDDLDAEKVILPHEGFNKPYHPRTPSVPFYLSKVKSSELVVRLASEGGAVIWIRN